MLSPKTITNMNNGNQLITPPYGVNPSTELRCPSWNTQVRAPYAAPIESASSRMDTSARAGDPNASTSSTNATTSTNVYTSHVLSRSRTLKSSTCAVLPATATSTPGSA